MYNQQMNVINPIQCRKIHERDTKPSLHQALMNTAVIAICNNKPEAVERPQWPILYSLGRLWSHGRMPSLVGDRLSDGFMGSGGWEVLKPLPPTPTKRSLLHPLKYACTVQHFINI